MTLPDIDDLDTFGGAINDYRPVPDPTVERSADEDNKIAADVGMLTRTAARGWFRITGHATTPVLVSSSSMIGSPTLSKGGTGVYVLTFAATVNDELGVSHNVNIRAVDVHMETTHGFTRAALSAPNEVAVYLKNTAAADNDFAASNFWVYVY